MDTHNQRKPSSSGHENHGVHICHRCGWPFPNPHPSAKHRRAHKRICGAIEGYKLTDSVRRGHLVVSDDEHSDEDKHNSGRSIEKGSSNEFASGGAGGRSNRSEDDFFSDAVAEFSDSGSNSGSEARLEGVRELDKNVETSVDGDLGSRQPLNVNANADADTAHPPNTPTGACQVKNPEVLEGATNQLRSTTTVQQIVSSCSDLMETDVKGNEENDVDKTLPDDVALPTTNTASKTSEADSKLLMMVEKTSDGIIETKKEQSDGLESKMSKDDSCESESVEHVEASGNTVQVKKNHGQDREAGMHVHSVELCNTREEGNEDTHVLSVADDLGLVDHPEIMIEDFKDHKPVKLDIPLTLGSGELAKSLDDCNKDTVYQSDSSSYSSKLGERFNISPVDMNAMEENLKQEGGGNQHTSEVPVQGEADILNVKVMSRDDVASRGLEDPPCTTTTEADKIQTDHCLEGLHPRNSDNADDMIPMVTPLDGINLSGGDNADDHETERIEKCDADDNKSSDGVVEEKLPASEKTPPEFLDSISTSEADQMFKSLGKDSTGVYEMAGIEFSDTTERGSGKATGEDTCAMDAKMSSESEGQLSEPQVVTDDGAVIITRNLQETESNCVGVSDSTKDGSGTTTFVNMKQAHSNSESCQDEGTKEAIENLEKNNDSEVPVRSVGSASIAAELNLAGDVEELHRNPVDFNLKEPEPLPVDSEFITKSSDNIQDNEGSNAGGGGSDLSGEGGNNLPKQHVGVSEVDNSVDSSSQTDSSEAIKRLENNNDSEIPVETVGAVSTAAALNHAGDDEVLQSNSGDFNLTEPEPLPVDSGFFSKNTGNVEDNHGRNAGVVVSGVSSDLLGEGDNNLTKQQVGVSAVDISVDSSSQTDSLEGNWGSVSVLSIQSDVPAAVDAEALLSTDSLAPEKSEKASLEKPVSESKGHRSEKSDAFEAPSFATLVESVNENESDQKVASTEIHVENTNQSRSEALRAGWFRSLTNVVNESQGRKKNEEIIAKGTNWSTAKQHMPLKNLLGEANHETRPKSPVTKPSPTPKDETAEKNNGVSAPRPTTVNSILRPEESTDRDEGKEWNSPARYPTGNKKEKRKMKGKPYWVPFVCCSSVN